MKGLEIVEVVENSREKARTCVSYITLNNGIRLYEHDTSMIPAVYDTRHWIGLGCISFRHDPEWGPKLFLEMIEAYIKWEDRGRQE